jgi:hypothetical protein
MGRLVRFTADEFLVILALLTGKPTLAKPADGPQLIPTP